MHFSKMLVYEELMVKIYFESPCQKYYFQHTFQITGAWISGGCFTCMPQLTQGGGGRFKKDEDMH